MYLIFSFSKNTNKNSVWLTNTIVKSVEYNQHSCHHSRTFSDSKKSTSETTSGLSLSLGRLTCILHVEIRVLGPWSVSCQRGGPYLHRIVPRMHYIQFATTGLFIHVPRHTVMQLLQKRDNAGCLKWFHSFLCKLMFWLAIYQQCPPSSNCFIFKKNLSTQ